MAATLLSSRTGQPGREVADCPDGLDRARLTVIHDRTLVLFSAAMSSQTATPKGAATRDSIVARAMS